jgi:NADPH2:quinone reductase
MRALLSKSPGRFDSLALETVADPTPKAGEVLVGVKACGVNYPDVLIIEDKYQARPPRPFAPGGEIAGVIEALGDGVSQLQVGDRVIGQLVWGGMAEKVVVAQKHCLPMPDAMSYEDGAAFMITFGTTYYALKQRAQLKKGETLLVLGAAGGVGLATVELGRVMGARVIAACSTQEKLDLCLSHGATDGILYPRGTFDMSGKKGMSQLFKNACGPNGPHVIYDAVGGEYSEAALRTIAWEGRFLVVGFPSGIPSIPLNLALLKGCQIIGVFWGAWIERDPNAYLENSAELLKLYTEGNIKPHISAVFPLADGAKALAHLAERKALGKVVIRCT